MYNPSHEKLLKKTIAIRIGTNELLTLCMLEKHGSMGTGEIARKTKAKSINTEAARLNTLRRKGLIENSPLRIPKGRSWAYPEYQLTERGKSLFIE